MARVKVPITVIDPIGNAVVGAAVQVLRRSDGSEATLYQAETGPTTTPNPTTTDAYGRTQAWVDRGAYNAIISGTGIADYTQAFEAGAAGDGTVDEDWLAGDITTRREVHTWAVGGEIKVAATDTDYIPGMYASKLATETLTLKGLQCRINGGTSVTFKLQKNGADVTGYTGLVVDTLTSTGEALGSGDVALADLDYLAIVVTAVAGTPKNLTVTAIFERA